MIRLIDKMAPRKIIVDTDPVSQSEFMYPCWRRGMIAAVVVLGRAITDRVWNEYFADAIRVLTQNRA